MRSEGYWNEERGLAIGKWHWNMKCGVTPRANVYIPVDDLILHSSSQSCIRVPNSTFELHVKLAARTLRWLGE